MDPSEEQLKVELLVKCAKMGQLRRIRHLVEEKNTNVDRLNRDGENALWAATIANEEIVVRYLLSRGAKVDIRIKSGYPVPCGFANFFSRGRPSFLGVVPLLMAANNGNVNICKLLIEHGADPKFNSECGNVLDAAIRSRNLECVDFILSQGGYDINRYNVMGLTPLMFALYQGNPKAVRYLLEKGADYQRICAAGDHTSFYALGISGESCLKMLLKHIQSKKGKEFVSEYVNRSNMFSRRTVLHMAHFFGRKEEVKILLKYGADPTMRDNWGNLPEDLQNRGYNC